MCVCLSWKHFPITNRKEGGGNKNGLGGKTSNNYFNRILLFKTKSINSIQLLITESYACVV